MMDIKDTIISVKNLSKVYNLKDAGGSSGPSIKSALFSSTEGQKFQALENITFDLLKGEVLGIIGSNGSGKSTLLRILSEITKPSEGEAIINGSVTSILDIGSNFHPDLTGRENVIIQLRSRGIPKSEFPELVLKIQQFSEIGDFMEQAIKYYSNGMFLRLAFSVAFNISADILILDEVLSVGDEGFRLKSHHLIRQFTRSGKTILFVSHNRNEILELCDKCIWLDKGKIKRMGPPAEVLKEYFEMQRDNFMTGEDVVDPHFSKSKDEHKSDDGIDLIWSEEDAPGTDVVSLRGLSLTCQNSAAQIFTTEEVQIRIVINKKSAGFTVAPLIEIFDVFYQPVLIAHLMNNSSEENFTGIFENDMGLLEIGCTLPARFLSAGTYYLHLRLGRDPEEGKLNTPALYRLPNDIEFKIRDKPGHFDYIGNSINAAVRPAFKWSYTKKA